MIEQADGAGRIAVVGAGTMGRGIAQVAVTAGYRVLLSDARAGAAEEAVAFVTAMLARAAEKGRLAPSEAERASRRLAVAPPARQDNLVIEAVVEDLDVKQRLFAQIEAAVAPDALLATNTSSLSVTEIASLLAHPERLVGLHFFNPVPLRRLVEIVPGELTSRDALERAESFVTRVGHHGVVVSDSPGFLVNHVGRAYSTEALRLLDEGVADPAALDRVLRDAAGFPMGPFELLDLTGLDVSQPVMESVWAGFYGDPRLRPSPTGRRRLAARRLGRKSGTGFYRYGPDGPQLPPEQTAPAYDGAPLWVSHADEAGERLAELLRGADVAVESGHAPTTEAVAIITPWGSDVTTAALAQRLPPERVVGVDQFGRY
ncbi:MAG: 3-hydroxyacyl-CoA dehydrogenase NAD-binding domain-containing protein, partial [Actinomycetota bacterium]|nr:3-hydroxyacyl-CoA dehydrogenase NAD-binding domain-containing protein [Actinomycetota bacterium]